MLKTVRLELYRVAICVAVIAGLVWLVAGNDGPPPPTAPMVDHYRAGVNDIRGGQMPSGSVPCDVLPVELRAAVAVRITAGLHPERILGQVHEKYRIVLRECGMAVPDTR